MQAWIAVAAGGMVGALLRYFVVITTTKFLGQGFPFGTLIVNIGGSFAMGLLIETIALSAHVSQELRLFLVVGLLGSFTTFSTFSLDVYTLYERQAYAAMTAYAMGSFALSLLGLVMGLALARRLIAL